jgi:hypothetical protein
MVELVDTLDSKSSSGNRVGVQVPLPLPFLARGIDPLATFTRIFSPIALCLSNRHFKRDNWANVLKGNGESYAASITWPR